LGIKYYFSRTFRTVKTENSGHTAGGGWNFVEIVVVAA
jgi:hypothetical protein